MRLEDIEGDQVRITGKGSHQRLLPWLPEVADAFDAYLADHPAKSGPVVRAFGGPTAGKAMSPQYISTLVGRWVQKAGIKAFPRDGVSAHALRHTAASDSLKGGAHLRDLQRALGHTSIATTERYLSLEVEGLTKALGGRRYASEAPADPPSARSLALPSASDLPTDLGEATVALAEVVAELRQAVDALGERALGVLSLSEPEPEPDLFCPECGLWGGTPFLLEIHRARHCPICGKVFSRPGVHCLRAHGVPIGPGPDGCGWDDPHEHTSAGHCVCPLCRQTSASLRYVGTMADHYDRPHTRCPDCDRSFIRLDLHRRRAHPWMALAPEV
jgi:integrase-like protein